jgi:hypothetical protein
MTLPRLRRASATFAIALVMLPPIAHADFIFGRLVPGPGLQANGITQASDVSDDGRTYVFESNATNWISPSPTQSSVYALDLSRGTIFNASTTSAGATFNGTSFSASVSRDGRYVAMQTFASNLGLPVATSGPHVVRKDTQTGALLLVSATAAGVPASGSAGGQARESAISGDGSVIVFRSDAANLVAGDTSGTDDIFAKLASGAIAAISVTQAGIPVGQVQPLTTHAISENGRFVVWGSGAANILSGVPGGTIQVWLRDRQTQTTELISRNAAGAPANSQSDLPSISPNGRFVAFRSFASNLAGPRTDAIYVRDRTANTTTNVPRPVLAGSTATGCRENDISDLAIVLMSCTFPAAPAQVYVHIPGAVGTPFLLSGDAVPGDAPSGTHLAISGDARAMTFDSIATNLVPLDSNNVSDVFVFVDEAVLDTVFADGFE